MSLCEIIAETKKVVFIWCRDLKSFCLLEVISNLSGGEQKGTLKNQLNAGVSLFQQHLENYLSSHFTIKNHPHSSLGFILRAVLWSNSQFQRTEVHKTGTFFGQKHIFALANFTTAPNLNRNLSCSIRKLITFPVIL